MDKQLWDAARDYQLFLSAMTNEEDEVRSFLAKGAKPDGYKDRGSRWID